MDSFIVFDTRGNDANRALDNELILVIIKIEHLITIDSVIKNLLVAC